MAVTVDDSNTSQNSVIGAAPGPTVSPQAAPSSTPNLWATFGATRAQSPDIEAYVKSLQECLAQNISKMGLGNISVNVVRTSYAGAYAVQYGNMAELILFADALPSISTGRGIPLPKSSHMKDAMAAYMQAYPTSQVRSSTIIARTDYGRSQQMASTLLCNFRAATEKCSIRDLGGDVQYVINADHEGALSFIAQQSPHAVPAYSTIGLTISTEQRLSAGGLMYGQNRSNSVLTTVAAATAYVEFIKFPDPATGFMKYQPVVRISEMSTILPHPIVAYTLLVAAADKFIINNGWREPYMRCMKGDLNIGNLDVDPDNANQRYFAQNPTIVNQFIVQNCTQPVLSIDILDGRSRIPIVSQFSDATPDGVANMIRSISNMFNVQIAESNPFIAFGYSHVGTYAVHNQVYDTRRINYLQLTAENGALGPNGDVLLGHYNGFNEQRHQAVMEFSGPSFDPLYDCRTVIVAPQFLSTLSSIIASNLLIKTNTNGTTGYMDMTAILAGGFTGQAFQPLSRYSGGMYTSGFSANYRL